MTRLADERGTTMVELAVVAALIMIVLLPVLRFLDSAVSGASELQRSTWQLADARLAVDGMTRELRQAYSGDDAVPAVTVDGPTMTVLSPDTSTPFRLRRITYRIEGGWLLRSTEASTQTSCPTGAASCGAFGPPWTFDGTAAPVQVLQVESGSFALVGSAAGRQTVQIALTGTNSKGRAPRPFVTTVELRNT